MIARTLRVLSFATAMQLAMGAPPARAEPPASPPASAPAPAAPPKERAPGEWGWILVGAGIVAGGALTTYGLTFDCLETSLDCQRHASLAIWGGLGIAGASTAIGIAVVQAGRARVRATVAPSGVSLFGSF
jgi:hypothetical protein